MYSKSPDLRGFLVNNSDFNDKTLIKRLSNSKVTQLNRYI